MKLSTPENTIAQQKELSKAMDIILTQISNKSTKQNGISQYHKLIQTNITFADNITLIFHKISSAISSNDNLANKKLIIKLVPEFLVPFSKNIEICYQYTSRLLTVIQNSISFFSPDIITETFSEILVYLFRNEDKKNCEIFQGFCIYNMKQSKEMLQLCGVKCLYKLIEQLNYFVNSEKYMKYLYEKLILFLENENFVFKCEILMALSLLIKKCGGEKFSSFANITLYKILDFIAVNDNSIIKEALNIIKLLLIECKGEIISLKSQIEECLSVLVKKEDKEIKNECQRILTLLQQKGKPNSIFLSYKNEKFFDKANASSEILIYDNNSKYSNSAGISKEEDMRTSVEMKKREKTIAFLLTQVKSLSEQQIKLAEAIESIQSEMNKNNSLLSSRITKLEKVISNKVCKENLTDIERINKSKNLKGILTYFLSMSLKELNELHNDSLEESLTLIVDNFDFKNSTLKKDLINSLKKVIIGRKSNFSADITEKLKEFLIKLECFVNDEDKIEIKLISSYLSK